MSRIELYCGSEVEHGSEKRVLEEIFRHLRVHGASAVVFANVTITKRQIDIFVATAKTTLLLEVKGFRRPIIGHINGPWYSILSTGIRQEETNAWEQARQTKYALLNRMKSELPGQWVPYPDAAVLFEGGIHRDSEFEDPDDKWVVIRGIERLGELLETPSSEPWPLDWVMHLAEKLNLRRCTLEEAISEPLRADESSVPHSSVRFVSVAPPVSQVAAVPTDDGHRVSRSVVRRTASEAVVWQPVDEGRFRTSNDRAASPRPGLPTVDVATPPFHSKRTGGVSFRAIGLLIAAAMLCRSDALLVQAAATTAMAQAIATVAPTRHHRPTKHVLKPHRRIATDNVAPVPPSTATDADSASSVSFANVPSGPSPTPRSSLSCPPGVDRLGCTDHDDSGRPPSCPYGYASNGTDCVRNDRP